MNKEKMILMDIPPLSAQILMERNVSSKQIQDYNFLFDKLRKRIHPQGPLAPNPEESLIPCEDKVKIYVQAYIPKNAHAILIGQHGNSIQSDLHIPLADHLYPKGIGVVALDNRGHGRSGPETGDFDYPERIFTVYSQLIRKYSYLPVFVMGESLGTTMWGKYFMSQPPELKFIKGVIYQVPPQKPRAPFDVRPIIPIVKPFIFLAELISLNRPCIPFRAVPQKSYLREFSYGTDQVDPIREKKANFRHIRNLLDLIQEFPKTYQYIPAPLLLLEGSGDSLLDQWGTVEIFRRTTHVPRRIRIFPHAEHSLFHDRNAQGVFNEILHWIEKFEKK